ncbi:hypothetical protein AVEN_162581-1, partial [Araneus ventricosus]
MEPATTACLILFPTLVRAICLKVTGRKLLLVISEIELQTKERIKLGWDWFLLQRVLNTCLISITLVIGTESKKLRDIS